MRDPSERRARSELVQLIGTALMLQQVWILIIIDQKWSHYAGLSEVHRVGMFATIFIGVLATAAYARWVVKFSETTEEGRKEKPYRRIRDLAWAGWIIFGVCQINL